MSQNSIGFGDQSFQPVTNIKAVDALELTAVNTTSVTAITSVGTATITVASIAGIVVDQTLYIDSGTNQEAVIVTAVAGSTFTAYFLKTHSGTYAVSLKVLRQNVCIGDPTTIGNIASVTPKGTQGVNAVATQQLKDAGRNSVVFVVDNATTASTTEVVEPFAIVSGLTNSAAQTAYTVPPGKTFHLQSISVCAVGNSGTNAGSVIRLRASTVGAGTATTASPVIASFIMPPQKTTTAGYNGQLAIPEGMEFSAGQSLTFTRTDIAASALQVSIFAIGYEF